MSGDVTYQALERLTYMPDRDAVDNGLVIGGQKYYDVLFTGGDISNVTLEDVTLVNPIFSTPVPLLYGGTGASLVDPNADRIMFWDDSAGQVTWLTAGSGLVITGTTMTVAGVGLGDVTGPSSSTDNSIARFDGTTGKIIQGSGAFVDDSGNITATNLSGTNTGDQTITLTGDVTGSGTGSFATTIGANKVTDAMLRQSGPISVIGRSANSTGNVADISAISDGNILRRSGSTLAFGGIDLSNTPHAVVNALGIGNGGTGQTTASAAFDALKQSATTSATGVVEKATQAEVEGETADKYPDAASLKYNPGVAKFWVLCTVSGGTPSATASYNVSSITDDGPGLFQINFTTSFSSANYAVAGCAMDTTGASNFGLVCTKQDDLPVAANCPVQTLVNATTVADIPQWYVAGFGDQ